VQHNEDRQFLGNFVDFGFCLFFFYFVCLCLVENQFVFYIFFSRIVWLKGGFFFCLGLGVCLCLVVDHFFSIFF